MNVRWLLRSDLDDVIGLYQHADHCVGMPYYAEDDIVPDLRERNTIGIVCEMESGLIVGSMLYKLEKGQLVIISMVALAPMFYVTMIDRLRDKLSTTGGRRKHIIVELDEYDVDGQIIMRDNGFLGHMTSSGSIRFVYSIKRTNLI